jgi:putative ATP-binding cassette transporter
VPEGGEILADGVEVSDANRDWYRQSFSAVFSDYHLFERMWGRDLASRDDSAARLLERLHLDHKVSINDDGAFSTIELSQGQRKRLALVAAYLQDRPVYVFDEWASDQDPLFRRVFYKVLLPELKARKKIVVVVSHDEEYFHVADQFIKIQDGRRVDTLTAQFMSRLRGEKSIPPPAPTPREGRG